MPTRVKTKIVGSGILGDITIYLNGHPYEEVVPQEPDWNDQPYFEEVVLVMDVIGEHLDKASGAELDHPFLLERFKSDGLPTFSGVFPDEENPGYEVRVEGWVPEILATCLTEMRYFDEEMSKEDIPWPLWLQHLDLSNQLVPVVVLMARTNPATPEVDIPSFLFEGIGQLPSLLYNRGASLLSRIGGYNLMYEFGWKPVIDDVGTLLEWGARVSKKLGVINRLIRGMYKSRSLIEKHSESFTANYTVDCSGVHPNGLESIQVEVTRRTKLERWGTVTYCLKTDEVGRFRAIGEGEKRWLATQAAFGLHWHNPAALWEILPWSWFVDWFIPIQSLLYSYQGLLPVYARNINVMTKTRTEFSFRMVDETERLILRNPPTLWRETLERSVLEPDGTLPEVSGGYPTLDIRQLGILASIRAGKIDHMKK